MIMYGCTVRYVDVYICLHDKSTSYRLVRMLDGLSNSRLKSVVVDVAIRRAAMGGSAWEH